MFGENGNELRVILHGKFHVNVPSKATLLPSICFFNEFSFHQIPTQWWYKNKRRERIFGDKVLVPCTLHGSYLTKLYEPNRN